MNDRDRLRLIALLSQMEEGLLTEPGRDDLVAMLKASATARQIYLEYTSLASSLVEYAEERVIAADEGRVSLDELLAIEMNAETHLVELDPDLGLDTNELRSGGTLEGVSGKELVSVLRYVAGRLILSRPGMASMAAAVLVIVVSVLILLSSEPTPEIASSQPVPGPMPTAIQPIQPADPPQSADPPSAPILTPVGTLTAMHDARWQHSAADATPQPGHTLYSGQQFTLTHGFAQFTTNRGAVAILEAPCTVKLIDHDNAIRLVRGKLVGICETDSSKGFIVRAPNMDVTDLGTRFGIDCSGEQTLVKVFEGEVLAAAVGPDAPATQTMLVAYQSAVVNATSAQVQRVDPAQPQPSRFVTSWHSVAQAPELTGDIRYEPSIPGDLRVGAYEHNEILLFPERVGISLQDVVTVNIVNPGTYKDQALQRRTFIAPDAVDSYLIHLDALNEEKSGWLRTATIRFSRPIVGVMTSADVLALSDQTLGTPATLYGSMTEGNEAKFVGLDMSGTHREEVTLSQDRKTLTLHISTGTGIDQVRVLVASKDSH